MKIIKTKFKGLLIIKQSNFTDKRGNLRLTFIKKKIKKKFIFDYCTISKKNVVRGFHFQSKFKQSKFVNVLKGKILDVVIDLRKNSKTFGKTFKIILSQKNSLGLYIPAGFAHAYYSYDKENIIYYKLDNYYAPKYENGIIYNDKKLKIKWPKRNISISRKDKIQPTFSDFLKKFKSL
tara:strand:- start:467 stop:1000 length:534 start_codon:yes stop_codon:yes gene_type:complete